MKTEMLVTIIDTKPEAIVSWHGVVDTPEIERDFRLAMGFMFFASHPCFLPEGNLLVDVFKFLKSFSACG